MDPIIQRKLRGIPAKSPLYDEMEDAVCHCIQALRKMDMRKHAVREKFADIIFSLADAGGFCGPRVYCALMEQYYKTVIGNAPTYEDAVFQQLAGQRQILVQGCIPPGDPRNAIHHYLTVVRKHRSPKLDQTWSN